MIDEPEDKSLLADLKRHNRDYWIVPTSPSGNSNHPEFNLIHVRKGANTKEIELWMEQKEKEMIETLEKPMTVEKWFELHHAYHRECEAYNARAKALLLSAPEKWNVRKEYEAVNIAYQSALQADQDLYEVMAADRNKDKST